MHLGSDELHRKCEGLVPVFALPALAIATSSFALATALLSSGSVLHEECA